MKTIPELKVAIFDILRQQSTLQQEMNELDKQKQELLKQLEDAEQAPAK